MLLAYGAGRATHRSRRDMFGAAFLAFLMIVLVAVGFFLWAAAKGGFD